MWMYVIIFLSPLSNQYPVFLKTQEYLSQLCHIPDWRQCLLHLKQPCPLKACHAHYIAGVYKSSDDFYALFTVLVIYFNQNEKERAPPLYGAEHSIGTNGVQTW